MYAMLVKRLGKRTANAAVTLVNAGSMIVVVLYSDMGFSRFSYLNL